MKTMKKSHFFFLIMFTASIYVIPVFAHSEELFIVSNSNVQWSSDGVNWFSAVECWIDPRWPLIEDASWVWRTEFTDAAWEYNNLPEGGWYFRKIFNVEKVPVSASIQISADNAFQLWINDVFINGDGPMHRDGPEHQEWKSIENYDITNVLLKGENVIDIRALNCWESPNPAGLIFKISIISSPNFVIPELPGGTFQTFSAGLISLLTFLLFGLHERARSSCI